MKRFIALTSALIATLVGAMPWGAGSVAAQELPFGCDGRFYYTYSAGFGQPNQLAEISFDPLQETPIGLPASPAYNSLGLNPVDGFLYGVRQSVTDPFPPEVFRISRDGSVTNLGAIAGFPPVPAESRFLSATFLADGRFVINEGAPASDNSGARVAVVDVATTPPTLLSIAMLSWAPPHPAQPRPSIIDIALNPTDGRVYGSEGSQGDEIVTIDLTTGVVTAASVQPASPTGVAARRSSIRWVSTTPSASISRSIGSTWPPGT